MFVRKFEPKDAEKVSELVVTTLRTTNIKDYSLEYIENIETLEKDEFFLRAKRVEIPASITATPFYLKMGYNYKNGITLPDEEGLLRLEKYR